MDAFASHVQPQAALTSRHSQKEAYKQAVNDAWDNGNNPYAAAAKVRRQQRGTVVQQGLTPSPLQPGLSQLGYNSGGHASLALRPGMAPLPTSVNAPALAPNPNAPGLPQNPLGIEMGRGSSMYAKGIPNNGMPDMWSSTCLAQGEFGGTYKDPITGITYAMVTEPVMEGVSARDVHAVYERNKPSRALEALTGVPASSVLVPQPKEQYAGPLAVIESQPPLPSQISEYIRTRQTQAAILQSFDAGSTEQLYGLQEDGFKDGMLGTTYILRPRYDTQTLMDNNEINTGVMNRIPNPESDDIEFPNPSRAPETRPIFYMARPKPSLPTRTHLDLEEGVVLGPRQEINDRLQRQMASLPSRTHVDLEGINSARQDVYDRLPQGRDTVIHRAPDAMDITTLTRVPLISERISDSTATLATRQTLYGLENDVYGTRSAQISENATARDAGVARTRQDIGGLDFTSRGGVAVLDADDARDGRRAAAVQRIDLSGEFVGNRALASADSGQGYDARVAMTRPRISLDQDSVTASRSAQANDSGQTYDARVAMTMPRISIDQDSVATSRSAQANDSGQTYDARVAMTMPRISLDQDSTTASRSAQANDSGQTYDARVAMTMPRISIDQDSVATSRNTQTSDGGHMYTDRLAGNRQGSQYSDAQFRSANHAGVQESLYAGEHANSRAALYPSIEIGGGAANQRATAADGDMGEDARISRGRQQLADVEVVSARSAQVGETSRINAGAASRTAWQIDMDGSNRGAGNGAFVYDGGLGSQGQTAMPYALPKIDGFVLGHRAVAVHDNVAKEMAGSRPGAIMHLRPVLEDAENLGQVRVMFADSSRPDMANPIVGQHAMHGFDLANTLSQLKPAHYRDDYMPMQTDRHGLVIINPEIEREETNPANVVRDYHAIKAHRKSREANANKNPVMCMTRESYETDAYDTDG